MAEKNKRNARTRLADLERSWSRFWDETRVRLHGLSEMEVESAEELAEKTQEVAIILDGLWSKATPSDETPKLLSFLEKILLAARSFMEEATALGLSMVNLETLAELPEPSDELVRDMEHLKVELPGRMEALRAEVERLGEVSTKLLMLEHGKREMVLGEVIALVQEPVQIHSIMEAYRSWHHHRVVGLVEKALKVIDQRKVNRARVFVGRAVAMDPGLVRENRAPHLSEPVYMKRRHALELLEKVVVRLGTIPLGLLVLVVGLVTCLGLSSFRGDLVAKQKLTLRSAAGKKGSACEELPSKWRLDCIADQGTQKGVTKCMTKCVEDGMWVSVNTLTGGQCWVRMDQVSWKSSVHSMSTDAMHQKCVREEGEKRFKDLLAEANKQLTAGRAERCVKTVTRAIALPGIPDKSLAEKLQRECQAVVDGEGLVKEAKKNISSGQFRKAAAKVLLLSKRGVGDWKSNQRRLLLRLYRAQTHRYVKALQQAVTHRPSFDLVVKEEQDRVPLLKTREGKQARAHELKLPDVQLRTDPAQRVLSVTGIRFKDARTTPPATIVASIVSCPRDGCPDEPERQQVSWCLAGALQRYVLCKQLPLSLKGGAP